MREQKGMNESMVLGIYWKVTEPVGWQRSRKGWSQEVEDWEER